MAASLWAAVLSPVFLVSACDWFEENEVRLEGTRISILEEDEGIRVDPEAAGIIVHLPRPELNPQWGQAGGNAKHVMGHLGAPGILETVWSESVGDGSDSEHRLLSTPIVANGIVYTIDVYSLVRAVDANTGDDIWDVNVTSPDDEWFSFGGEGSMGGGIAYEDDRLFITTGFAQVVALNAISGEEVWRQSLPSPMRAPPTVADGRVYVITIDNQAYALDAENGDKLWSHSGIVETAGVLGGAGPAVSNDVVIVPYSSGEINALRASNGRPLWSDNLGAINRLDAVSSLADIRGRPAIDGSRVIAISHAGRMVALDLRSGLRVWEKNIGGIQSPWVAGNFIYVLAENNKLVCMTKKDGYVIWISQLLKYEDPDDEEDPIIWSGPVLAGDRLIVTGSHGFVASISPYNGVLLGQVEMPDPVKVEPVVANGKVYILTDDAELIALQ